MAKIKIHKPGNKQYTDEFKFYVVKYIKNHPDKTVEEIADKFNINVWNVKKWPQENKAKIGKAIIQEWRNLLLEAENMRKTAFSTGVNTIDFSEVRTKTNKAPDLKMMNLIKRKELYKNMILLIEEAGTNFFNALNMLPSSHKCYLMCYVKDLCSLEEMAKIFHITVPKVREKLNAAYIAVVETFDIEELRAPLLKDIELEAEKKV